MNSTSRKYLFALIIIFGLLTLSFGTVLAGSTSATILFTSLAPTTYITQTGNTGGEPVANLALMDQTGIADNPSSYVTFTTPGVVYKGYRTYYLPDTILRASVAALKIKVNYKGPAKTSQTWAWYLYDWTTSNWVSIGNNSAATANSWILLTFNTTMPRRFINANTQEIRLQIVSNNASGDAKLDYESIIVNYNVVTPTAVPTAKNKILIDFSPYVDGQDPNTGTIVSEAQIRNRMQIITPYSSWIRSFSCGNGLEVIGRVAHEMNLKVAVNAWIGNSEVVNQEQITCLISQANAGYVDMAIVGSEALLRGDVTADTLTGYIDQVRLAIPPAIPVTTADVYSTFLDNPALVDHLDFIFANIYPFWEGYSIQYGTAMLDYYYKQLVSAYPTKTVKISETGWPSCGKVGNAIGSPTNEANYFAQAESWAHDKNITLFYFEGMNESWKTNYEGAQGACWGIWSKTGVMKTGMAPVFNGKIVPYSTTLPFTCNTGQVSFTFTKIPAYGSVENVQGKTCGVVAQDHKIVLFIYVGGNWWVKPYFNSPKTAIHSNGNWSIDYTTGGIDQLATKFRAYLIPNDVNPFGDLSGYPMISAERPKP